MKNSIRLGALAAVSALALAACGTAPGETTAPTGGTTSAPVETVDFKACMVSDAGGFDDKSFNQAGFEGLKRAEAELGIEITTAESKNDADYNGNLDAMVAANCDLTFTVGFLLADATAASATGNPDSNFGIIDFLFDPGIDNVKGLIFDTDEAAFLAGYVAAGTTQTGKVATFGGMNIPTVTIFMDGYLAGVNYYNEVNGTSVEVLGWNGSTGSFTDDFDDLTKGQDLANGFIDQGADIILPVAGPVGLGAAAAAKSAGNVWIIGVDSDWSVTASEYSDIILTSVMKHMGPAVFDTIEGALGEGFDNSPYVGTLENGGVGLGPLAGVVPAEVAAALEGLSQEIIAGSLATS